ncbi:MAG TPA: type II secretion system F family protein [Xanthobacteraceae bacterium]|jgi:general secretion pathway protein F|nr:type II secretion system F family protein [Xanthobacteraceae bacterium]
MQTFRYRAMTQSGELVNGSISAPSASEVAHRIEYLGLVPIETVAEHGAASVSRVTVAFFNRPRAEDVTIFTRDLALLLKAGARLDNALELLADDSDIGRLRPIVGKIRAGILAGESFADAVEQHPAYFPPIYLALVEVGETSGKLPHILEMLANERQRAEALRRKITDALQYPGFILFAASCVLMFFVLFVLPQFSSVLRDFGAKTDSMINTFLGLSEFLRARWLEVAIFAVALVVGVWAALRRPDLRAAIIAQMARIPGISSVFNFYRTALFCRNLGILLGSDVTLTATLRILVDIMSVTGKKAPWQATADRVRHGGKLSDALAASAILPAMAIRMLRIGEETGQLPALAGRVADFYEAKLQRSLDKVVAIVGPLAIISISIVVGGLIVSVMTALLSISQIVG